MGCATDELGIWIGLSIKMRDKQIGGSHYKTLTIQPWDIMESWFGQEGFAFYLRGNVIKYLSRYKDKNGIEDLEKARHYLDKLIEIESKP